MARNQKPQEIEQRARKKQEAKKSQHLYYRTHKERTKKKKQWGNQTYSTKQKKRLLATGQSVAHRASNVHNT